MQRRTLTLDWREKEWKKVAHNKTYKNCYSMRKQILVLAFITISCLQSYSQIIFENGYFIDESNNRIECLIKNIDWKNNPTEFEYKRHGC